MGAWHCLLFLQENLHAHKIPRLGGVFEFFWGGGSLILFWGGGGKCQLYLSKKSPCLHMGATGKMDFVDSKRLFFWGGGGRGLFDSETLFSRFWGPLKRGILWAWRLSCREKKRCPAAPIKLVPPILRAMKITDLGLFLILGKVYVFSGSVSANFGVMMKRSSLWPARAVLLDEFPACLWRLGWRCERRFA